MRAEVILKFHENLKEAKINRVLETELRALMEDMRNIMREGSKYFETNQQSIGMKHLFRVFSIKA